MTAEIVAASREPGDGPPASPAHPVTVTMTDSGVIVLRLPGGTSLGAECAEAAGAAVRHAAGARKRPVLIDVSGLNSINDDARDVYLRSTVVAAFGLLGSSPVDRVLAHYLLRAQLPGIPARYFSSESEALTWLETFTHDG